MSNRLPSAGPFGSIRWGLALQRDPIGALPRLHERFGTAVKLGYRPMRVAFIFGPEANEDLLTADAGKMSWHEAFKSLIPVDGETALIVSDGDDHRRRRRLVQPAFATRRVRDHLPLILEEVDRTIDTWVPGAMLDAYHEFRRAVRRIVVRALFGDHLEERADEIGDLLESAVEFVNRPPLGQLRSPLPGSLYRRALRGREAVVEIVDEEIERRRSNEADDEQHDVLGMLLAERDEEGAQLTDPEIADQVISLIAAGYDTTSAAVGWGVYALLAHDGVWARASHEITAVVGDAVPDNDLLARLRFVDGVVSETLRLYSPAVVGARYAVADLEVAGYRIPRRTLVLYAQYVAHRLPDLWPEPERFEPDRWSPQAGAQPEPHPYGYLPFGGGHRRCIGFALATLEVKAILTRLVQRTELSLLSTDVEPKGLAAMAPHPGVMVRVNDRR